ncbi:hypothetical protein L7F22_021597 [Adiantum nelumboides]|nr:hypothetical protein [Adiantum nelumboides]
MGCASSTPAYVFGKNKRPEEDESPLSLSVSKPPGEMLVTSEKVVLLGDSGVGKSSILQRLLAGDAADWRALPPRATLVTAFMKQTITVAEEAGRVTLEIWDTAGQERFCAMAPLYYRGSAAAIIVYDITSPSSFERARFWVGELMRYAAPDLLLALVGNKADLSLQRRVSPATAHNLATLHNIPLVLETSAVTAANIYHLFHEICRRLIIAKRSSTPFPSYAYT